MSQETKISGEAGKISSFKVVNMVIAILVIVAAFFIWKELWKPQRASEPSGEGVTPTTTACKYDNPEKTYVKKEKNCIINFLCIKGEKAFSDECGCGCLIENTGYEISIWDATRTFSYSVTSRFYIKLDETKYPQKNLKVSPEGILGSISNTPAVEAPYYAASFEGVKSGLAVIKNGDFSVDVKIYDLDAPPAKYENKDYALSFTYPQSDIFVDSIGYQYVAENSLARVDLPRNDFADTNLGEASFIVGASRTKKALDACLKPAAEESATTSTETINGTEMTVFNGLGVGAGNLYDTTSYRAVKNGACYEATLLLHSGRIENYDPGVVTEYDHAKALDQLKGIMSTFRING